MNYEEMNKQCFKWKENILKWKCNDISSKRMCDYLKEMKSEMPTTENITISHLTPKDIVEKLSSIPSLLNSIFSCQRLWYNQELLQLSISCALCFLSYLPSNASQNEKKIVEYSEKWIIKQSSNILKLSHPFSDNITSTVSAPAKQLIDSLCYDSVTINKTIFEVIIDTINEIMNNYDVISTNRILEMIITTIFSKSSLDNLNILFPDIFKTLSSNNPNNSNNILMNICLDYPSLFDSICDKMINIIKSLPFILSTILFDNFIQYQNDNQYFQLYYHFVIKIEKYIIFNKYIFYRELTNSFDLRLSRLLYLHNHNIMKCCNNDISTVDTRWNMIKSVYNYNNIDDFINDIYNWINSPIIFLEGINITNEDKRMKLWCFLHYFYSQILYYCYNLVYKLKEDENNESMNKVCVIISFMKFPIQIEKQNEYLRYLISFKMNKVEDTPENGIIYPIKSNDSDLKCYLTLAQLVVTTKDNENIIKVFRSLNSNKLQQLDCLMFIELFSLNDCGASDDYKDLMNELYRNDINM